MISVDTSVLIRLLVDDPGHEDEIRAARTLAVRAGQVFIPQVVQAEMTHVLYAAYRLGRMEIIRILEHMLHNQALVLQGEACFLEALVIYKRSNTDFSDCLSAAESKARDHTLYTFDANLSGLPNTALVTSH